jgi:uncharacterized protein YuzE
MAEQTPDVTYSERADALYIRLREGKIARTRSLDDLRMVDLDENGEPLGVELLHASAGVDLRGLPSAELVEELIRARHLPVVAIS